MHRSEESACQDQIGEAKQREQLGVVLRQVAIARLAMLEQALHDMKAMLDLRAHAGFGLLELLLGSAQWIFLERLAHARTHRNVPVDCLVRVFRTLANALVASVAKHRLLAAVQQRMRLGHVGYIACRADHRVHQAGRHVHAHVSLHAEVPVVPFLRLVHLGIALLVAIFRRRRRGDQCRVHDRPLAHAEHYLPVSPTVPYIGPSKVTLVTIQFELTADLPVAVRKWEQLGFVRGNPCGETSLADNVERSGFPSRRQPLEHLSLCLRLGRLRRKPSIWRQPRHRHERQAGPCEAMEARRSNLVRRPRLQLPIWNRRHVKPREFC